MIVTLVAVPSISTFIPRGSAVEAGHAEGKHGHQSLRGGAIQVVGDHHLEVLAEAGGRVRLYILGKSEDELYPVPAKPLAVEVTPSGGTEAAVLTLKPSPQLGEGPEEASSFVGILPESCRGVPFTLSTNLPLAGKLYRARVTLDAFPAEGGEHAAEPEVTMPAPRGTDAERTLYGTPGGAYTADDIRANGSVPASEKLKGVMASHDMHPKRGDRICPITNTKANPAFSWVIAGKRYMFCCPPCVDEFVARAKKEPASIKSPESYVKQ